MKKRSDTQISFLRVIILQLLLLCLQLYAPAQQPGKSMAGDFFSIYADTSIQAFTNRQPYYLCRWQQHYRLPVQIIRQLDDTTAIVRVVNSEELEQLKAYTRIAPANDEWKLSPALQFHKAGIRNKEYSFILTGIGTGPLLSALQKFHHQLTILAVNEPSHTVIIKSTTAFFKSAVLPLQELIFADVREEPHTETGIIGYNRSMHGINAVDYLIPGANGKNRVAGVKEQKMDAADLDLFKRVKTSSLEAPATAYHATVISSIIGGAGNSFYDGRGIAWGCSFFPSTFNNLFADDANVLNTAGVSVQNHSYGTVIQQFYGAEALSYDAQTWLNQNLLHVFSAGNQGTASATDGRYANLPGYANLTGNFKTAKNIITVGAIDNKGNVTAESSAGPLYDGRMAPQIMALGPNGTSDAAAVVTGTLAVLQQVYADSNSQQLPTASLIKSIIYNTADDINRAGIDHKTGFGLLNSYAAVRSLQQKEYAEGAVANGQQWTKSITVPANAASLKVTLCWTDSTAIVNNNKALVNDADLELEELSSGNIYKPWGLSLAAHLDSLAKLPVRKRDSLNTSEQVSISLPAAGNYRIRVNGTSISTATLPFHVAFHVDTLHTFQFISPVHASDVNRAENADMEIRWKTFVADTNETANLYISYNSGASWQLLKAAHKIYTNLYRWPVKDTASIARLKMETGFGDFFSRDFIISPVIRPVVDFLCADSFRLSWNKHIYAGGYKIFTLADSAYLKPLMTVTDSFVVMNRTVNPNNVYAVEPILINGLPAARSIAQDITQQGVKCFYRTLYYTLQDQNKLDLILELSIAAYADSLFFEQVTAVGGFLQSAGNSKVTGTGLIYQQRVDEIPSGTSYWRVRIKLKNGSTVYTEIVAVLTTGKKYLLFFPNPAGRNVPVTYMLQQGVPASSRLQLFDISGRMVKSYTEMPGTINAAALTAGLYIYKLLTAEGVQLETGKLVIQ